MHRSLYLGVAVACSLAGQLAAAQTESRDDQSTAAGGKAEDGGTSQGGGLDDIVVTARRRVERLQDVPVTVIIFSAKRIAERDLASIEKIAAATPQLAIGRSPVGSGAQIVLRGVGSSASSAGIEQSVAVVIDGVYYGQGRVINDVTLDLDRVEILKGPQALFFGKNATAGVISFASADPGSKPEFFMKAGYEFAGQSVSGEAIYSTPITDTLGIRVAAKVSKMFEGYSDNRGVAQTVRTTDVATGLGHEYRLLSPRTPRGNAISTGV